MNFCDKWIDNLTKDLPERCSTQDLVGIGLYNSVHAAHMARRRGDTPPYIQLGRKFIYPKEGIIHWLKENTHEKDKKSCSFKT